MLSNSNALKLLFTTSYPPDKIVAVLSGGFIASASVTTNYTIDHGFGVPVFLQMAYSLDGGTTWQDQNVAIPDLSVPSAPVFSTVFPSCYSTATQNVIVAKNSLASPRDVMFVAACIWNERSSNVISVSPPSGGSGETGFILSTDHNIQKVYIDNTGVATVPISGFPPDIYSTVMTISHGLGYIPNVRMWYEPVAGQIWPLTPAGSDLLIFGRYYVTTTDVVVELANLSAVQASVPLHWRIYLDE